MPPKKAGKKKDEVVDLPKASTLPDGPKNYFIGGWSSYKRLADITHICEVVRPRKEDDESTVAVTSIFVLPGTIGTKHHHDEVHVSHKMQIQAITVKEHSLRAAAFEKQRQSGGAPAAAGEGDAANTDGSGAAADGDDGSVVAAKPKRLEIIPDTSVTVESNVTFVGVRPSVTVAPAPIEVKAAAPTKGKKQSEEDKQREAEERRQREEAAIKAAKEEEARLNQFAMPHRWANVSVDGVTFEGSVVVRQAHIVFKNCTFKNAAVEVCQYAKVSFQNCLFSSPVKNALYLFPLAEVTVKSCVFSGLPVPDQPLDNTAFLNTTAEGSSQAVGVHTDGAKILIDGCQFDHLGTGVLFRGHYAVDEAPSAAAASAPSGGGEGAANTKKTPPATQVLTRSTFEVISVYNVLCDKACGVSISKNNFASEQSYYSLRVQGATKQTVVTGNKFVAKVGIAKGSFPVLHSNTMDLPLADENATNGNIYMEPTY